MKNIFLSILALTAVLFLLTSCGCKHEWNNATCTEPQTCAKCGKTQGDALGHKYGEEKTLKEATCTESGVKEYICTVCGEKKTTEIPANGHKWKLFQVMKEATCSETGKERYKCSACGETKDEEIAKLPHQYKNGYCTVCFAEDPSGVRLNPTDEEKKKIDKIKTLGDWEIRKEDDFYYLLFIFYDEELNTVIAPCVLEIRIENSEGETVYRAKRIIETSDYSIWSNAYRKWILASPKIMRSDIKEGLSSTGTVYFTVRLINSYFKECSLEISDLPVHSFGKEEVIKEATCGTEGVLTKASHTYVNYKCIECGNWGGKGPAGGYVFYDCDADNDSGNPDGLISTECGWRYLEAAPKDIDGKYLWGSDGSYGTETGIGKGKMNTQMLNSSPAAIACADYTYNGYSDWFLPSISELNLMYKNLERNGIGSFTSNCYWSSSEGTGIYAWFQDFYNGCEFKSRRNHSRLVRPIRAFL